MNLSKEMLICMNQAVEYAVSEQYEYVTPEMLLPMLYSFLLQRQQKKNPPSGCLPPCLNETLQDNNPLIGWEDELERTIQIICRAAWKRSLAPCLFFAEKKIMSIKRLM